MFVKMTNEELGNIIKAFFNCEGNCSSCPCDMTVCVGGDSYEKRKAFALEVASRLTKET